MPILAIRSLTRSLQSTGKWVIRDGTHTHTTEGHRILESQSAQRADAVRIVLLGGSPARDFLC